MAWGPVPLLLVPLSLFGRLAGARSCPAQPASLSSHARKKRPAAPAPAVERGRELRADYKLVARAMTRKGNALAKQGLLEEAIKTYQKSLTEHRWGTGALPFLHFWGVRGR